MFQKTQVVQLTDRATKNLLLVDVEIEIAEIDVAEIDVAEVMVANLAVADLDAAELALVVRGRLESGVEEGRNGPIAYPGEYRMLSDCEVEFSRVLV